MQNTHTWTETKPPCAYCKVLNIIVIPGKLRKINEGQKKLKQLIFNKVDLIKKIRVLLIISQTIKIAWILKK